MNNKTFEYNAAGLITKMTYFFRQVNTNDPVRAEVYTFTYDSNNQLAEAKITINGQVPTQLIYFGTGDTEQFSWSNGRLSQVSSTLDGIPTDQGWVY